VKDDGGKLVKISNASRGKITAIDEQKITVNWGDGKQAFTLEMKNKDFQMVFHGYARAAHKGQGETNDVQIVAAGDKGVGFAASARSLYVAITRARLHSTVVATQSGRSAMDDAALKDGGKTLAAEVAKEAKAEAMIKNRKDGIEISGAASPSLKDQYKKLETQKEQKAEFVLDI
jgi:ATP-dependent exoDNAse (exonuclease V) alpha subunit